MPESAIPETVPDGRRGQADRWGAEAARGTATGRRGAVAGTRRTASRGAGSGRRLCAQGL